MKACTPALFSLLLLPVAQALGATGDGLEEVIVSATRAPKPITAIPNTVKVIDKELLETLNSVSVNTNEALGFIVPSFTGGPQKMTSFGESMRGRTPLYMVDGIPQSTPLRDGKRSAMTVDPDFIDRVEVIYGANAIQGMGATGGVINYVTVRAPKEGWTNRVAAGYETGDFRSDADGYKVSALTAGDMGQFDAVVGLAYETRGMYYDGKGRRIGVYGQGETQDSKSWNLFTKLGFEPTEAQRLELMFSNFNLEGDGDYVMVDGNRALEIPTTAVRGRPIGGGVPENKARNAALTYAHQDLLGGTLTLQGYYYDLDALYDGCLCGTYQDPAIAPSGTLYDQSAVEDRKYGGKLTYVRDIDAVGLQVAGGLDYLRDRLYQSLVITGRLWVPEMRMQETAQFIQLEQKLLDERLRLSLGWRQEQVELTVPSYNTLAAYGSRYVEGGSPKFRKVLRNAGAVLTPLPHLSLYASYSEGFTLPDAGVVLRGINVPNRSVDSLVDLKPVIADNVEVGGNFARGGFTFAASYFWSDSDLGTRLQNVNGVGFVRREKTRIHGFETSTSMQFEWVTVGGSFAKLEGRSDTDTDGDLDADLPGINISPDRLNLYVENTFHSVTTRVQAYRLFDRDFEGGDPTYNFDGYTLADVIVSWAINDQHKITAAVRNVFDRYYLSYFSQTNRTTATDNYFAGRGRALNVRYQMEF